MIDGLTNLAQMLTMLGFAIANASAESAACPPGPAKVCA